MTPSWRFCGATPMRALIKAHGSLWKSLPAEERITLAWKLLRSDFFEEKDWGIAVLKSARRSLGEEWLADLEPELGAIVRGWATCDALCGGVFRNMLVREELRRRIVSWKDSADPWLQRATAVSFVAEGLRYALEKYPEEEKRTLLASLR